MEVPEKLYVDTEDRLSDSILYGFIEKRKDDDIEYIRTDAFIEKAHKWFKTRYEWIDIDGIRNYDKSAFDDFKNYIKDESNIYLSEYD